MSAHGVDTVCSQTTVVLNHEVSGVSLQTLCKSPVTCLMGLQPALERDVVTQSILSGDSSTSAS
ncbi:hypothetical protein Mapa_004320 [Marchantia paleacea]|nr:hypothetical protein Mapa_004320 [Marchantia paleacea]